MTDYSDLLESLLQCHGEPLTLERQGEAYNQGAENDSNDGKWHDVGICPSISQFDECYQLPLYELETTHNPACE